ncbi:MAG: hypothetical protein WBO12_24615, partial [Xanthobacteraceae bacterium]
DFMARHGGLMSYGADADESFERAAALAARIFHGEKPADLPVENRQTRSSMQASGCDAAIGLDYER